MQTKFFGRNALGGVLCALFAGLVFIVSSCDSGGGSGDSSASGGGGRSSSAYVPPEEKVSPSISVLDTTFRWYQDTKQSEVVINVTVRLTGEGGAALPDSVKGFDSVVVKLNDKLLNKGGTDKFIYQYDKSAGEINVENELDLAGICGTNVSLTVSIYAFGKSAAESIIVKKLEKKANVGNCVSSSSTVPSSSSAFVSKPLIPISFTGCPNEASDACLMKMGQGINLTEAKGGVTGNSELSVVWETKILATGTGIHSITDQFLRDLELLNCGKRGISYVADNTGPNFYPCPTANRVSEIDLGNQGARFLVKTTAAAEATDWVPGWFLVSYESDDLPNQGILIKAWKVN